ncbi:hypothetical protein GEO21_20805 [Sphingobacterium faecium]|uniref:hypothetical protein n=1 Tax=Sphingobacterium faecium TaxID=34087 RepID=UPI00135FABA9|nr:hypothetical protein [Sphingobacterium faecium]MQP29930.1 hypothetical protein [Sphingobacterium faecium]
MEITRLMEIVHAIKCCLTSEEEFSVRSFKKLSELKKILSENGKEFKIDSEISTWRNEYPEVSNEVLNYFESLKVRQ